MPIIEIWMLPNSLHNCNRYQQFPKVPVTYLDINKLIKPAEITITNCIHTNVNKRQIDTLNKRMSIMTKKGTQMNFINIISFQFTTLRYNRD